jgi:glycosyltransferase involved in cell wall biosynthesis
MKIAYIAFDPLKYPRIKKIAYSIGKCGSIEFYVMIPKIRRRWRKSELNRLFSAIVNYSVTLLQILFLKAEIFWVANCPDVLFFPLFLRKKRCILEYRSPWSIEVEREFGSGPWVQASSIFENIALRYARAVTLPTTKLLERVKDSGKPTFVIPNYPLKSFKASIPRERFRRELGLSNHENVVLFVGRLSAVEGADLLPDIILRVLEKEKDILFWIVGDGPYFPLLSRLAKKMPNNVRLFGWQPYERMPAFINAADVCIVPRHASPYSMLYNEENVQKISEYMFFKKPIVACGIAESEEYLLVDDMSDGILKASNGRVHPSTRKTWEDYCEKKIYEMLGLIQSGKI